MLSLHIENNNFVSPLQHADPHSYVLKVLFIVKIKKKMFSVSPAI